MQYLSASRTKTLQGCSWKYWTHYKLKLPDKSNHGSLRGDVTHGVMECLGNPRHKKKYDNCISAQSISGDPVVDRYVNTLARKKEIDDEENLALLDQMILEGLNYDFFGEKLGKPTEAHSELEFDITVDEAGKLYRLFGFIDKVFLYKKKGLALIRDFKTSKAQFKGKELDDNIQGLMYQLIISKLFPEYKDRLAEFVFLKFDCGKHYEETSSYLQVENNKIKSSDFCPKGGLVVTPKVSDEELEGLEYYLTEIQHMVNNFDEESAAANFAADQGFPSKEEGFSKKLLCGFGEHPNELKLDGLPKWSCSSKFSFYYYALLNKDGETIKTSKLKKELPKPKNGEKIEKKFYSGCPRWQHLGFNKEMNKAAKEEGFDVPEQFSDFSLDDFC